ncbi:MAG: TonB-dependent receptor, partial [Gammaproteobacteria bacterium]|nr:TonB-dependent receptor [Gammaproteobacteria bacterium]
YPNDLDAGTLYVARFNADGTGDRHTLNNSATWLHAGAGSYGYIGDTGSAAVSIGQFQTRYGLPVEEEAFIDMNQMRYDVQGILHAPVRFLESIELRAGYTDYDHTEFEEPGVAGTVFDNKQSQVRLEAVHAPIDGWRGVFGLQNDHREFSAEGEEAFVPSSTTEGIGLFLMEQRTFDFGSIELGARVQRDKSEPDDGSSNEFTPISFSAGSVFNLSDAYHLKIYLTRAQRSPVAEELYAFGPHLATGTYERGDDDLDVETASNADVGLDYHGERLFWQINVYYQRIEDYVYLTEVDQGLNADGSGAVDVDGEADRVDEEGNFDPAGELLLVDYQQDDAEFYGYEAQASYQLLTGPVALRASMFTDKVIGQLTNSTNLSRIPPARYGFGLDVSRGPLMGNISYIHALSQNNLASLETPTKGYTMLTANVSYRLDVPGGSSAEIYLQGRNLSR